MQPLAGYAVYLWHCTRDGGYSLELATVTGSVATGYIATLTVAI